MNIFDLIVLIVLAALTLRGVMKGMVSQIVSVGSYIVCWIVASRFAFVLAPMIPAEEPWNKVGAMIVLFVGTMIAIRFAHAILQRWVKRLYLDKPNKLLGGVLGFAKGLLVCMVLTFFGVMLCESTREVVFESKSGFRLAGLIAKTGAFIPQDSCELLRDQIELFNAKIDGTATPEQAEMAAVGRTSGTQAASGSLVDLFNRSTALVEEAQAIKEQWNGRTQGAVSLLDGIRRWWNGTTDEENADNLVSGPARETVNTTPATYTPPAMQTPPTLQSSDMPLSTAASSPVYQDEALLQGRAARPSEAVAATPTHVGSDAFAAEAMSIPRTSRRFFLNRQGSDAQAVSSERLLNSTTSNAGSTPAVLFSSGTRR